MNLKPLGSAGALAGYVVIVGLLAVGFGIHQLDQFARVTAQNATGFLRNTTQCKWYPVLNQDLMRTSAVKDRLDRTAPAEGPVTEQSDGKSTEKATASTTKVEENLATQSSTDFRSHNVEPRVQSPPRCTIEIHKSSFVGKDWTDLILVRIGDQVAEVKNRAEHHSYLMTFFYRQYFMCLSIASIAWILASALLVIVANKGWSSAPIPLTTSLLFAFAVASLFTLLPKVFEHDKNIADNQALYLSYVSLEDEILSSLATRTTGDGKAFKPALLIARVDKRLSEINRVRLGFDAGSFVEYQKRLQLDQPTK